MRAGTQALGSALVVVALATVAGFTVGRADATTSSGACCRSTVECGVTDQFSCEQVGGIYFGDGTVCADVECDRQITVPVSSLVGLVGVVGALMGFALFRLFRSRKVAAPGTV